MTVINPSSISGITSITMPSGDGNVLTVHTNDGTERFRIDSSGNVKVGSACTISQDGDVFFTGVTTATTFTGAHSGSGANLTNLPAGNLTGALPAISGASLTGMASTENVRTGILDVAGVSTFRNTMNVGAAVTISESGIEASGIGITVANINGAQIGGRRNVIINGAMNIAQRGPSSAAADFGCVDRMKLSVTNTDQLGWLQKQTSDGPDGFENCYEVDITTAESALDADDLLYIRYAVESQDLISFFNANGTGRDFTLSFYVKAYQAGTYQVGIYKEDSTRFITKTYTINSSATWQRVVIPFTGDTDTGGMTFDNTIGFQLSFMLGAGTNYTSGSAITDWGTWGGNASFAAGQAVNVMSSTDNYFRITGIQLELGSQATDFEHVTVGEELIRCKRYYQHIGRTQGIMMNGYNTNSVYGSYLWQVEFRAAPTNEYLIAAGATGCAIYGNNSAPTINSTSWNYLATHMGQLYFGGSFTQGASYHFDATPAAGFTSLSAEL